MATIVSFHAHPDDEAIATGGVLALAAEDGHRVVLVFATRGEHGEVADGVLGEGETLAERRVAETAAACRALGVQRHEFLGYVDSGMIGTPENDLPGSFWQADIEEAARRLADILVAEQADVLTVYDDHGNYGHPDHIQVHRVGVRAAELAGTARVLEAVINRDAFRQFMAEFREAMVRAAEERGEEPEPTMDEAELEQFGVPEALITTAVDVRSVLDRKLAAMAAHASQIPEDSFFFTMPREIFDATFGTEWFVERGRGAVDPSAWATSLFA
jgi:LmbE family N-acetylglucosaminyl deacetylase